MKKEKRNSSTRQGDEVLAYMGEILMSQLEIKGVDSNLASAAVLQVMDIMRFDFGGQLIYFPKGISRDIETETYQVWEDFCSGKTVSDLAQKYGHSIQWVYKKLAKMRAIQKIERDSRFNNHL